MLKALQLSYAAASEFTWSSRIQTSLNAGTPSLFLLSISQTAEAWFAKSEANKFANRKSAKIIVTDI